MNSIRGFTKHGIEKIGDNIRAYVYLVLSSRQAARHVIIRDGAQAAAAQEIFVDNLEDVINKEVSLEDDIARFQDVLKYARSKLYYSVGRGIYIILSNMLLKPLNQVIEGYNNKLVVNTGGSELGKSVHTSKPVVHTSKPVLHTSNTVVHTSKPVVYTSKPVVHT